MKSVIQTVILPLALLMALPAGVALSQHKMSHDEYEHEVSRITALRDGEKVRSGELDAQIAVLRNTVRETRRGVHVLPQRAVRPCGLGCPESGRIRGRHHGGRTERRRPPEALRCRPALQERGRTFAFGERERPLGKQAFTYPRFLRPPDSPQRRRGKARKSDRRERQNVYGGHLEPRPRLSLDDLGKEVHLRQSLAVAQDMAGEP